MYIVCIIFSFFSLQLLDQGCDTYHQSVLSILNEFLIKLEENSSVDMGLVTRTITRPVTQFIKVQDILKIS